MDFNKHELAVLSAGLDAIIRNEGAAIGQAGVAGLRKSLGLVNLRFSSAISALEKIETMAVDLAAREEAEAAAAAVPDTAQAAE